MDEAFSVPIIEKLYKKKFSAATNIQLLWKGAESFSAIFDAIQEAKKIICLEFYIFRNDETGRELAELLKRKSREGIAVYLLYDHFGSFGTPRGFWKDMRVAGIQVCASHPFKFTAPFRYAHRDHRKLIIVDGEKAFTGGLNIANEYRGFHLRMKSTGWRDTGVMVEGPIVQMLLDIFKKYWELWNGGKNEFSGAGEHRDHAPLLSQEVYPAQNGVPALPIFVGSARQRRNLRRLLYYSINHARREITLTTAYFTPSRRMIETLEDAVMRGVRVRLLVPGISDLPIVSFAGRAFFSRLLKAGVEIYIYLGEILHAKTFIFDHYWSIVGSTNLDFRSLRYNDEGNIGILDKDFAERLSEVFEQDMAHSVPVVLDKWQQRPFYEKAVEWLCALFKRKL